MDIYLMQHGVATSEEEDPSRPLTPEGRDSVERVSVRARLAGVRADRCVHSGKVRAEQTARILGDALGASVQAHPGLNPSDPVQPMADWLAAQRRLSPEGAIVVVGHLPFLDRLASLLVTGHDDAHAVRFQNAALVRLVPKDTASGYSVAWILPPDLA